MQKTTAPGSSSGNFIDKEEGVSGTKITAADMNAHQNEIVNAITAAGLTPSGGDLTQLTQAIRNLAIPVGFVFTQLPGEAAPATLYPWATWTNVSSAFAGAFFRAEGGKAATFGGGVQDHAFQGHSHLSYPTNARQDYYVGASLTGGYQDGRLLGNAASKAAMVTDGVNGTPSVADETRPTNFTVRIWRRTA